MKKSPFHEDYVSNPKSDKRPTIRIPIEAYNQLNNYFEENNLDFSKGIRSLCYDKLDTICNERKTFNNLEVFMLIPKMNLPYPYDENFDINSFQKNFYHILTTYSEIIAVVNTECDFKNNFNHIRSFNDDYVLCYQMEDFKAENFPLHILQNTNESKVYRTHEGALNSFHSLQNRLGEVFHDSNDFSLDVNDCYFVRFPLNNYLDEFRSGQYQQEAFSNTHEGVYVFEAFDGAIRHYCYIDWDYSKENENIAFEIYFTDEASFLDDVYKTRDKKLIHSALAIIDGENRRKRLEDYKYRLLGEVSYINMLLEENSDND